MNYLAHLFLAEDTDASRVGNLLGDFARGNIDDLKTRFPLEVVRGIMMHRAIDRYTDSHPEFKKAKSLLAPSRRRFAGIMIDIFFDHFLCKYWQTYSNQDLSEFISEAYQAFERHPDWLEGRLAQDFPRMKNEDWLSRYEKLSGIEETLQRVSQRSKRIQNLADGASDLRKNYAEFEAHFTSFMPQIIKFSEKWLADHPSNQH